MDDLVFARTLLLDWAGVQVNETDLTPVAVRSIKTLAEIIDSEIPDRFPQPDAISGGALADRSVEALMPYLTANEARCILLSLFPKVRGNRQEMARITAAPRAVLKRAMRRIAKAIVAELGQYNEFVNSDELDQNVAEFRKWIPTSLHR